MRKAGREVSSTTQHVLNPRNRRPPTLPTMYSTLFRDEKGGVRYGVSREGKGIEKGIQNGSQRVSHVHVQQLHAYR